MKVCAVSSCKSTSVRNPELNFFGVPKDIFVREEWVEILSHRNLTDSTRVCELHFRAKDIGANKKSLKAHAVPVIKVGKLDLENSDDEFMRCDGGSDSDPDIVEVKKISKELYVGSSSKSSLKIKSEPTEVSKQESSLDVSTPETETGRRPSRRAAKLAAQKIHNTVRQFGLNDSCLAETDSHFTPQIKSEPRQRKTPNFVRGTTKRARDQREWHSIRAPRPDIDLQMDCHEELLSPVQAEAILKAQLEYNAVMKKLRNLKASNARIICTYNEDTDLSSTPSPSSATLNHSSSSQKITNVMALTPAGTGSSTPNTITVVPVRLVTVHSQPSAIAVQPSVHVIKPGSPAFIAADLA